MRSSASLPILELTSTGVSHRRRGQFFSDSLLSLLFLFALCAVAPPPWLTCHQQGFFYAQERVSFLWQGPGFFFSVPTLRSAVFVERFHRHSEARSAGHEICWTFSRTTSCELFTRFSMSLVGPSSFVPLSPSTFAVFYLRFPREENGEESLTGWCKIQARSPPRYRSA